MALLFFWAPLDLMQKGEEVMDHPLKGKKALCVLNIKMRTLELRILVKYTLKKAVSTCFGQYTTSNREPH